MTTDTVVPQNEQPQVKYYVERMCLRRLKDNTLALRRERLLVFARDGRWIISGRWRVVDVIPLTTFNGFHTSLNLPAELCRRIVGNAKSTRANKGN